MAGLSPFLFAQIDKIFENVVHPDEYLQHQRTFLPDSKNALTTIPLAILLIFVWIKFIMADLSPVLFAQINKIFIKKKKSVQINIGFRYFTHALQSSNEFCEVLSGSNSK